MLTGKQEAFCQAFIENGGNRTEAYKTAGYKGGNEKTINEAACRLARNSKIVARLEELRERHLKRHDDIVDRIVDELSKLGFSNMLDYVRTTDNGDAYVDLSELTRDQAAAISEIVVDEYTEGRGEDARDVKKTKFKLSDKRSALVDLGKQFGMFKEPKDNGGNVTIIFGPGDENA